MAPLQLHTGAFHVSLTPLLPSQKAKQRRGLSVQRGQSFPPRKVKSEASGRTSSSSSSLSIRSFLRAACALPFLMRLQSTRDRGRRLLSRLQNRFHSISPISSEGTCRPERGFETFIAKTAAVRQQFLQRRLRMRAIAVVAGLVCVLGFRAPVWASGLSLGTIISLEGAWLEKVASYRGVCGSLPADITCATLFFILFAVCAGTETAITTLWPWKVREFAQREQELAEKKEKEDRDSRDNHDKLARRSKKDRKPAGKWTALREDIQRFMQTILIGATLSGVLSTAFATEICGQLFGERGLAIAATTTAVLQLTLCEIVPKAMAVSSPYVFAQATLPFFYRVSAIVYPVSKMLNEAVSLVLKIFGISVDTSKTPYVSEEELDLIFSSAMKSGVVDAEEGEMIRSVRNLDSKKVKEVMTPLVDMIGIESTEPIAKLHRLILDTQFSRIPVYSTRFDNIIGIVSQKTLMKHAFEGEKGFSLQPLTVEEICDKPAFVPETMSLLNALRLLKERTLAICVDEYGGTTGLVTLEDVLEEIVGEIYDSEEAKDQAERVLNRSKIIEISPGRYSMSAVTDIDDVEAVFGIELPKGDYISIGGFICDSIDRIPAAGEAVSVQTARKSIRFEVVEVDDRKIVKIEAYVAQDANEDSTSSKGSQEGSDSQQIDDDERAVVLEVTPETEEDREKEKEKEKKRDRANDQEVETSG